MLRGLVLLVLGYFVIDFLGNTIGYLPTFILGLSGIVYLFRKLVLPYFRR